jgi:hypothetical protein
MNYHCTKPYPLRLQLQSFKLRLLPKQSPRQLSMLPSLGADHLMILQTGSTERGHVLGKSFQAFSRPCQLPNLPNLLNLLNRPGGAIPQTTSNKDAQSRQNDLSAFVKDD